MRAFYVSAATSIAAMALGSLALLVLRPGSLLVTALLALCSALGLALGFGARLPGLPAWARLKPVKGALCITLGVAAMYLPANFVLSMALLAIGTRMVWTSACDLAAPGSLPASTPFPGPCMEQPATYGALPPGTDHQELHALPGRLPRAARLAASSGCDRNRPALQRGDPPGGRGR